MTGAAITTVCLSLESVLALNRSQLYFAFWDCRSWRDESVSRAQNHISECLYAHSEVSCMHVLGIASMYAILCTLDVCTLSPMCILRFYFYRLILRVPIPGQSRVIRVILWPQDHLHCRVYSLLESEGQRRLAPMAPESMQRPACVSFIAMCVSRLKGGRRVRKEKKITYNSTQKTRCRRIPQIGKQLPRNQRKNTTE